MQNLIPLRLSVHQLVDFLLRTGSIDNRVFNLEAMNMGTRLHAFYQKKQTGVYHSEYYLEQTFEVQGFAITLHGRADGIIGGLDYFIIDEIKSTVIDLEEYAFENKDWHLGQAKCYALMYALEQDIPHIGVRLTYIHQRTMEKRFYDFQYQKEELLHYVEGLLRDYLKFYQIIYEREKIRDLSIKDLKFPFSRFRKGQKKLAQYAYAHFKQGGTLFVEAPTGIGKTMSVLYPAVQTFGEKDTDKIFYLTAKTSGQEAAFFATTQLKKQGLKAVPIIITAKDKICPNPGTACNPDHCPLTKGYYQKVKDALFACLAHETTFTKAVITTYAEEFSICPFEFELDLSLYADIIICDYNYLFDPLVYMRRYFDEDGSRYLALVDEAHNLVERARDMYSATLTSSDLEQAIKAVKSLEHPEIKKALRLLKKDFSKLAKAHAKDVQTVLEDLPHLLLKHLQDFLSAGQEVLRLDHELIDDDFRDFFFTVNRMLKIYDFLDETYIIYYEYLSKDDQMIHIFNLDPAHHIKRNLERVKSRLLFSATLTPVDYYVALLGGKEDDPLLLLDNPFASEQRLLMIAPTVSTTYQKRAQTYGEVADYIEAFIEAKVGNYLVFFPSYAYLQAMQGYLEDLELKHHFRLIIQTSAMNERDKEEFLASFLPNPEVTTVGLAVLGGSFSEGIDLQADRLIGTIVIGVGLPQLTYERDLIRAYYDDLGEPGFDYSYTNPGMNRVLQAVGRLIRSEDDYGVILLLDDRYLRKKYRALFKRDWDDYQVVTSPEDVTTLVTAFWEKQARA